MRGGKTAAAQARRRCLRQARRAAQACRRALCIGKAIHSGCAPPQLCISKEEIVELFGCLLPSLILCVGRGQGAGGAGASSGRQHTQRQRQRSTAPARQPEHTPRRNAARSQPRSPRAGCRPGAARRGRARPGRRWWWLPLPARGRGAAGAAGAGRGLGGKRSAMRKPRGWWQAALPTPGSRAPGSKPACGCWVRPTMKASVPAASAASSSAHSK